MVTNENNEENLDIMFSDIENSLKETFKNDKELLANIINDITGIPKEDIIER